MATKKATKKATAKRRASTPRVQYYDREVKRELVILSDDTAEGLCAKANAELATQVEFDRAEESPESGHYYDLDRFSVTAPANAFAVGLVKIYWQRVVWRRRRVRRC